MAAGLGHDPIGAVAIKGGPGWRPRQDDRWGPGVSLAVLAHLGLVLALTLAVNWKVQTEVAVEAEVWSEIPRAAGPAAAPPPPPQAAPEPKPVPPQATPQAEPQAEPKTAAKPDIVAERTPPKKASKEKASKENEAKEKKRKEPKETFDTTPPKPSRKTEAKPDPKADKQSAAEREALRQANLARMMSELGGGPGGAGRAAASAGPSKSYIGRLIARIKPNVVFTDAINGNPLAQVEVRCAPDGRIVSRKILVTSGVPAWDAAVLRALDRTEVLPLNEQGRIEPVMLLDFKPLDF